jgi:hypothetical protein
MSSVLALLYILELKCFQTIIFLQNEKFVTKKILLIIKKSICETKIEKFSYSSFKQQQSKRRNILQLFFSCAIL